MGFLIAFMLIVIGVFMTAAEARACAYERNNIGPVLLLLGVATFVGACIDVLI